MKRVSSRFPISKMRKLQVIDDHDVTVVLSNTEQKGKKGLTYTMKTYQPVAIILGTKESGSVNRRERTNTQPYTQTNACTQIKDVAIQQ